MMSAGLACMRRNALFWSPGKAFRRTAVIVEALQILIMLERKRRKTAVNLRAVDNPFSVSSIGLHQ